MTNEMLANECESVAESMEKYGGKGCGRKLREAAARLRKIDTYCSINERQDIDNAELRRRLKVAEDALEKLQDRLVSSVHDGTIDPHEALKIAERALAAIRKEGGES